MIHNIFGQMQLFRAIRRCSSVDSCKGWVASPVCSCLRTLHMSAPGAYVFESFFYFPPLHRVGYRLLSSTSLTTNIYTLYTRSTPVRRPVRIRDRLRSYTFLNANNDFSLPRPCPDITTTRCTTPLNKGPRDGQGTQET
jgi:hypothetical protein